MDTWEVPKWPYAINLSTLVKASLITINGKDKKNGIKNNKK